MVEKMIRSTSSMRRTLILLGSASFIVWQAPALAQTCSCPPGAGATAGVVIRADEPPPPLPEYDQPPMPASGYIWTPGYWAWNNYDYYWVPGTWVEPPQPGLLWTPGYWGFVGGFYAFHRGYWGDHVGFYGGVDYGFGYAGHGYEGGRWDNGHFFYNRVVNNFGNVHVTNVYEKNITINNNTRVSFNGGKGGIEARPTSAEEAAAREQRIPPTQTQVEHARTASMNGALFQSNNHGRPAIAATQRPAAFSGPGVEHAKEGGSPATTAPTEARPGVTPPHPAAVTTPQRPEGAPAHPAEAPAAHEPENRQGERVPEHREAPAQNELRNEPRSAAPAPERRREGPVVEHPPVAPHAEPPHAAAPHVEAPRPEAPAARPAPHPEPHPAARPAGPHPGAPNRPAPHRPEEHQ